MVIRKNFYIDAHGTDMDINEIFSKLPGRRNYLGEKDGKKYYNIFNVSIEIHPMINGLQKILMIGTNQGFGIIGSLIRNKKGFELNKIKNG